MTYTDARPDADVHDTSGCPPWPWCSQCGATCHWPAGLLTVTTLDTPCGVVCLTVCGTCRHGLHHHQLTAQTIRKLVADHQTHLNATTTRKANHHG